MVTDVETLIEVLLETLELKGVEVEVLALALEYVE